MPARDNGAVLRKVGLAGRLLALAIVGLASFSQYIRPRDVVIETTAFAIAALTVAAWEAADFSPRARAGLRPALPFLVGTMAVTTGWASLTGRGGSFNLLATMATIWAGYSLSTFAACSVTGIGAIAVASAGLAYSTSTFATFGYPIVMLLGLSFGLVTREHRQKAEQSATLLAKADQLRDEQARAATLEERNRIAREIHDVLAHSLGALGVQVQAAQALLTDQRDVERAVELLGQARRTAAVGLEETRRALYALRAGAPPLADALAEISAGHERHYAAPVSCEVAGAPRPLSADAGLALTRTAQEALVNTAKHAPRQPVDVRLDFGEGLTTLTVANRRPGPETSRAVLETANAGYGLAGMRERLLLIGGSLLAGPDGGGKWVVTAQVPQ